jgi:hypothetical protein
MEGVVDAPDVVVVEEEALRVRFVTEAIMMPLSVITGTQGPCLALVMAIGLNHLHSFNHNFHLNILLLSMDMAMVINLDHKLNHVLKLFLQEALLPLTINGGILILVLLTMLLLMQPIFLMLLHSLDLTRC